MSVLLNGPVSELADEVKRFTAAQTKNAADVLGKIDRLDTACIELRQQVDNAQKRADDLEVKLREKGRMYPEEQQRIADVLTGAAEFARAKSLGRGDKVSIPITTKDILGLGIQLPSPTAIVGGPSRMYEVAGLIPQLRTTSGAISFLRETSFTDAAAPVAEGAAKPQSEKTFLKVNVPVETIAHYFKVSKQSYDDTAGLAAEIDNNLTEGLNRAVEAQLLKGTGTSPQLTGIYPLAPAATVVAGTPTIIDKLISGVTELAAKGYRATGIVMSPADVGAMMLLKDTGGRYIVSGIPPLPRIVSSPLLAAGEWLIGDWTKARLVMREDASIQIASQHDTDFTHNMLTALGEVRLALAIYQIAAFLKNPAGA